jgi:acetyltransferase-like isoleucine patch superfamily enzyme
MDAEQLSSDLHALYEQLRERMRSDWQRDLPLYELLFDRWERARANGFGEGTSVYQSSYVFGDVSVGRNTWIGPFTILDGSGGLAIGSNCSISAGVQIYTHDTVRWALSGGAAAYEYAPVTIADDCYIGPQTVVARGVTIGEGCVVGACSFVNRSLEPLTLAAGTPARRIGHVERLPEGSIELVSESSEPAT